MITITTNASLVAAELEAIPGGVSLRAAAVTRETGTLFVERVKGRAESLFADSDTGELPKYSSTFESEMLPGPNPRVSAFTADPRGKRFEFGFMRTDASGRHYHQAPIPHFFVEFDAVAPAYAAAIEAIPI
jgi:hypothetical protein